MKLLLFRSVVHSMPPLTCTPPEQFVGMSHLWGMPPAKWIHMQNPLFAQHEGCAEIHSKQIITHVIYYVLSLLRDRVWTEYTIINQRTDVCWSFQWSLTDLYRNLMYKAPVLLPPFPPMPGWVQTNKKKKIKITSYGAKFLCSDVPHQIFF